MPKKVKKPKVVKTRNSGTMSDSQFLDGLDKF
jgi:hypothetical protein